MKTTGETAFETVIEAHLLDSGYLCVAGEGFDRARSFRIPSPNILPCDGVQLS